MYKRQGYGRNYLIPKGLAHEATASNRRFIANLQAARATREAEELRAAQEVAAKISGLTVDPVSYTHLSFGFPKKAIPVSSIPIITRLDSPPSIFPE